MSEDTQELRNEERHNRELVRKWVSGRLFALRSYISMLPGSRPIVDRLTGPEGEKRAARIVQFIEKELGYELKTSVDDSRNRVRRSVAGVFGAGEQ